jgi:ElaA protein
VGLSKQIAIKHYRELSKDELYRIMVLRNLVFVVGQQITAEPEVDGRDPECEHAMLCVDGELVGTARIFCDEDPAVIGRVAVHTDWQGRGLGTVLMQAIQQRLGARLTELHAQAHLEDWYSRLGWQRVGETFEEAKIPHVMMRWGEA